MKDITRPSAIVPVYRKSGPRCTIAAAFSKLHPLGNGAKRRRYRARFSRAHTVPKRGIRVPAPIKIQPLLIRGDPIAKVNDVVFRRLARHKTEAPPTSSAPVQTQPSWLDSPCRAEPRWIDAVKSRGGYRKNSAN